VTSTPGDIRNATVTFLKDNSVILGCMNLPVNLVNPADTKTGTAGCNWTASVGNYTITVMVGGYYKDDGLGETETSLEVAPGGGTNFITGGGYVAVTSSAGDQREGSTQETKERGQSLTLDIPSTIYEDTCSSLAIWTAFLVAEPEYRTRGTLVQMQLNNPREKWSGT
jgi:hypothetical protein